MTRSSSNLHFDTMASNTGQGWKILQVNPESADELTPRYFHKEKRKSEVTGIGLIVQREWNALMAELPRAELWERLENDL
jgi:hypothetical protein